ncbi:MAG TPA: thiamine phosphate synthase [Acidisarcina sp.]|nr:thiamine phosphate synthase [Acidisarcina sp.]
MRLYAITDTMSLSPDANTAGDALVALASQWAAGGVEVIQIREPQLSSGALEILARRIIAAVREAQAGVNPDSPTKILINRRTDVALAAGADGVHLPGTGALTPAELRRLYDGCTRKPPIVSVACHSVGDVERARDAGATMALFAPVFGKVLRPDPGHSASSTGFLPGVGLAALQAACRAAGTMPVFALGGVTRQNAAACIEAGAAGVAGIRIFQSGEWQSGE